jgi:hypothetical protein
VSDFEAPPVYVDIAATSVAGADQLVVRVAAGVMRGFIADPANGAALSLSLPTGADQLVGEAVAVFAAEVAADPAGKIAEVGSLFTLRDFLVDLAGGVELDGDGAGLCHGCHDLGLDEDED